MTSLASSSNNTASSGTAVTVAAPSGTTTGDLVVVIVHCNGVTTIADNNGSTPFTAAFSEYQETVGGLSARLFTRRIQAGDPTTYAFTLGASGRWTAEAFRFSSPHASVIFDVASSNNQHASDGSFTINANAITTLNSNSIHVVAFGADGSANALTGPGGSYTTQQNTGQQSLLVASAVIASPGSTGTQTATMTSADGAFSFSFAIRDHLSGGGSTYNESVSEAASSSDAETATLSAVNAIGEAASSSDSLSHTAIVGNGLSEAGSAQDTGSNTAILVAGTNESAAASDAVSDSGNSTYTESLTESAAAWDELAVDGGQLGARALGTRLVFRVPALRREAEALLAVAKEVETETPQVARARRVKQAKSRVKEALATKDESAELAARLAAATKELEAAIADALLAVLHRLKDRRAQQ